MYFYLTLTFCGTYQLQNDAASRKDNTLPASKMTSPASAAEANLQSQDGGSFGVSCKVLPCLFLILLLALGCTSINLYGIKRFAYELSLVETSLEEALRSFAWHF